jgi:tetratricopeptide (TPR) repeat protein
MFFHATLILLLFQAKASVSVEILVQRAQDDLKAERYSEARQKLGEAVKRVPKNPALWSLLGFAHGQLNELDPAIVSFEKALALAPRDAPAYLNLGLLYWRKGDVSKALELYQKGLELDPSDVPGNENYALLLMGTGNYREAIQPLGRAKQGSASKLSIRVALIESFFRAGMPQEGERECRELIQSRIASPAEEVKLAVILIEERQPDMAEEVLKHAVAAAPDLGDAHGLLGLLHTKKGKYHEALPELQRAVQLSPDSAKYSLELAQVLLLRKEYAEALTFLQTVEVRFGKSPEFRYKLALACYYSRQYPKAIAEFEKLLGQSAPRPDLAQLYLGNSYLATGELAKAESCYRKAIQINPKGIANYLALAALLTKPGVERTDEAIPSLQKAMELDPTDPRPRLQLALCHEAKKDLVQAQTLLEEIVRAQPDFIPGHIALSRIYYQAGKQVEGDHQKVTIADLEAKQRNKQPQADASLAAEPETLAEDPEPGR